MIENKDYFTLALIWTLYYFTYGWNYMCENMNNTQKIMTMPLCESHIYDISTHFWELIFLLIFSIIQSIITFFPLIVHMISCIILIYIGFYLCLHLYFYFKHWNE
jgi:hypothetical protein